jgi:asparagine synthase (glutamine-hydrolysing)
MCGITGFILRPDGFVYDQATAFARALDNMQHRGPDNCGQYQDEQVWLGHVRLSILDLSIAGNQPMTSTDGRFVICYNGEVYNFADLALSLAMDDLRSHSDTEVILSAFQKCGAAVVSRFNGMFAFAMYDRFKKRLWLVRDRLGIKPLYYRLDAQGLAFASEIKALVAVDSAQAKCDLSSMHEWLFYGNSLGERTLYQGVQQLLPGHILELDIASFEYSTRAYWSPQQQAALPPVQDSSPDMVIEIRRLLEQAVKRQLVSDVPVGVFLSGGIDSSAITAFATRHYDGKLATYSAGFDFDKGVNELPMARKMAQRYGTEHNEIHISGFEIADTVEKMVHHHDMPFSDAANIPLFLLASRVAGKTKVVLQGDGGDELFGGYRRYSTLSYLPYWRWLLPAVQFVNGLTGKSAQHFRRQRYLNALSAPDTAMRMALLMTEEDGQSHPADMFTADLRREIERHDAFLRYRQCQSYFADQDIVNQMALVDSMIVLPDIFLQKVDRSTMAASLEVRVPFLDHDLVDYCMRIPGFRKVPMGQKKWLLKKSLEGLVPNEVLYGKKTGFGVPFGYWLCGALKPLFFDHLAQFQRTRPGVLEEKTIRAWYDEHVSRRRDRSFLLWKVLNFMIWANQTGIGFTTSEAVQ